jgi:hypothetical protein
MVPIFFVRTCAHSDWRQRVGCLDMADPATPVAHRQVYNVAFKLDEWQL